MKRLTLLAVTPLALAALGGTASTAAAGKSTNYGGTYGGLATHPNPVVPGSEPTEKPWTTKFSVSVLRQGGDFRISSVYAEVRTACPDQESIQDVTLFKSYSSFDRRRRGPRVTANGRFTITGKGITISGRLLNGHAAGTLSARSDAGCRMDDVTFTASRRSSGW